MTFEETEIVANAGVQLREIAERLTLPANYRINEELEPYRLVARMDAAALSISEVYGQLSALPLDTPEPCYAPFYWWHAPSYCTWPDCDLPRAYPHTSTLCAHHMAIAAAS